MVCLCVLLTDCEMVVWPVGMSSHMVSCYHITTWLFAIEWVVVKMVYGGYLVAYQLFCQLSF